MSASSRTSRSTASSTRSPSTSTPSTRRSPAIPPDRVRLHLCWGNYDGPHTHDVPLEPLLPIIYRARVGALSLPLASPRHQHELKAFRRHPLPDGMLFLPGVIDSTTNVVEHPEVVADRICAAVRGGRRSARASWRASTAASAPSPARSSSRKAWCGRSSAPSAKARTWPRSGCGADATAARGEGRDHHRRGDRHRARDRAPVRSGGRPADPGGRAPGRAGADRFCRARDRRRAGPDNGRPGEAGGLRGGGGGRRSGRRPARRALQQRGRRHDGRGRHRRDHRPRALGSRPGRQRPGDLPGEPGRGAADALVGAAAPSSTPRPSAPFAARRRDRATRTPRRRAPCSPSRTPWPRRTAPTAFA